MPSEERSNFVDFEFDGQWWLPENPDRRIYGTLRYSRVNGISIDLMNPIQEREWKPGPVQMDSANNEYKIVLGQSDKFESCTALRAIETFVPLLGVGRSRLRAHRFYVGGLFSTEEEIQFDEQKIEFTYLEDWVGINPFHFDFSKTPHVIEVPVDPTELLKVQIEIERMDLSIYLAPTVRYGWQREFSGGRRGWICIKPEGAQPYSWYEHIIRRIGNLLTLCIGEPVFPRRIKGKPTHLNESALEPKEVDIYLHLSEGNERSGVSSVEMPVPYLMIRDRLDSIIKSWFSIHEEVEPVVGLLLSTYYNPHMYVETEFLTLIQAIEILHRRIVGGSYLSIEEWQPHYEAMVRAIPGEIKAGHRAAKKSSKIWP